jgi:Uma2 family endonuclease
VIDGRTVLTEAEYERLALAEPDEKWEFSRGRPRRKPPMAWEHNFVARRLARTLMAQLEETAFDVIVDQARARRPGVGQFIPDVVVVPMPYVQRGLQEHPRELESYSEPVPLIVEVWSPSTGAYDHDVKLADYRARGDAEVWLIHPYERWLRAWRRQPDGSYVETRYGGDAVVEPASLPGVRLELGRLFDW